MARETTYPELSTARLRLRRPVQADAPRLAELADDREVARMLLSVPHPYATVDAEAFIAGVATPAEGQAEFLIEADDDGMVGMMGFQTEPERPGPLFGYWIGRPFWGRGYATEAAAAALRWSDEDWRRKVVLSGHFPENAASGRVLDKAGFLYTGVVEHRFSRARGEPAATRMMVRLA